MRSKRKIICFFCVLIIAAGFFLTGCNNRNKTATVNSSECGENHVSFSNNSVTVDVPPNAAITKIYAFVIESSEPFNRGEIAISTDDFKTMKFLYYFNKDIATSTGNFETTFEHPLCVGAEGAKVKLTSAGISGPVNSGLVLNVLYCPSYSTK